MCITMCIRAYTFAHLSMCCIKNEWILKSHHTNKQYVNIWIILFILLLVKLNRGHELGATLAKWLRLYQPSQLENNVNELPTETVTPHHLRYPIPSSAFPSAQGSTSPFLHAPSWLFLGVFPNFFLNSCSKWPWFTQQNGVRAWSVNSRCDSEK